MRFEHVLRAIYNEPWLILPQSHFNIQQIVQWKMQLSRQDFEGKQRTGEDCSGGTVNLPSMVVEDGIAKIPFGGVLIRGADGFQRGHGALSHDDVITDVEEALADPDIKGLWFESDSPGGTMAGSFELADIITAASQIKPSMNWVQRLCCSAAQLSLAGCTMHYGSYSSECGAVECYMAWINSRGWFEEHGLKTEIIKSEKSPYAAAGLDGTDLTDDQRAYLLSQVEDMLAMYVDRMHSYRPDVDDDSMRGQTFIGQRAVDAGFLDCLTTKAQAMADLRKWVGLGPVRKPRNGN